MLGEQGIFVWDGNYYALAVTERLDLERGGGMVCIGAVHYDTVEEIHRLGDALRTMAGRVAADSARAMDSSLLTATRHAVRPVPRRVWVLCAGCFRTEPPAW